jgi:hypothetical protein
MSLVRNIVIHLKTDVDSIFLTKKISQFLFLEGEDILVWNVNKTKVFSVK